MSTILVVDDEETIRMAFAAFLADEGHTGLLAASCEEALPHLRKLPEIAFIDYRLPGRDGLSLLEETRRTSPSTAAVLMTAHGRMDVAVRAMQNGAYDYLSKPLDLDQIRLLIDRIRRGRQGQRRVEDRQPPPCGATPDQLVGRSAVMGEIFKTIGILTTQEVTVLLTGESGTGKELVARAIHDNSARKNEPFIAVNCGAIPEQLLESEMFGHEKGAFTGADRLKPGKFELAGTGTIFLDEIGDLQPSLQVKLLRVLQEQSFYRVGGTAPVVSHARLIAATNRDLLADMRGGLFRKDLYYRLHLVHLALPPLRQRREDIPLLTSHFLEKINRELGSAISGLEDTAAELLLRHDWPGNVRELENTLRRAMVLARDRLLTAELFDLPVPVPGDDATLHDRLAYAVNALLATHPVAAPLPLDGIVALVEKLIIAEALARTGGNQVQTAKMLDMHRSTLRAKMLGYGLVAPP